MNRDRALGEIGAGSPYFAGSSKWKWSSKGLGRVADVINRHHAPMHVSEESRIAHARAASSGSRSGSGAKYGFR